MHRREYRQQPKQRLLSGRRQVSQLGVRGDPRSELDVQVRVGRLRYLDVLEHPDGGGHFPCVRAVAAFANEHEVPFPFVLWVLVVDGFVDMNDAASSRQKTIAAGIPST